MDILWDESNTNEYSLFVKFIVNASTSSVLLDKHVCMELMPGDRLVCKYISLSKSIHLHPDPSDLHTNTNVKMAICGFTENYVS